MSKIQYKPKRFSLETQATIDQANTIVEEYAAQGYELTLRQLYYQMVARDLIPNRVPSYKRLIRVVADARLDGQIDWERICDLTRELRQLDHWEGPADLIEQDARHYYHIDKWADQSYRPEVWVEKDALRNVVARAADALDVPYFCCRGYVSLSEMWVASQRHRRHYLDSGQLPIIFYLGDHDPSGIDMDRDIAERLAVFDSIAKVPRIALNLDQVEEYGPPPNPAKETDSRYEQYVARFGITECWELDALDPQVIVDLITDAVESVRELKPWNKAVRREKTERELLLSAAERWDELVEFLDGK